MHKSIKTYTMTRILLSYTLILLFLLFSKAQAQTKVVGKLLNSDNQPIAYATVAIIKAVDSSVVKGNYTDDNGIFEFEKVMPGSYLVKAMAVGIGKKNSPAFEIKEGQSELKLEDITFAKSSVELKTVEVSAVKPLIEFKNGTTILNVDNTALAAGNTAYDILKRAPGVSIDNNNNISIQGKQGVKVLIDGRMQQLSLDQLANMLKSMNAEGIDKIEVMKNPSSKYDAEGTSGIIQIKTKKAKLIGFNGSATVGANKGNLWGGNGGVSLNYKGENFSVFSSVNAQERNRKNETSLNRKIGSGSEQLIFDQKSDELQNNQSANYKVGADWYVSDKTTLGVVYDGGNGKFTSNANNKTSINGKNTVGFDHLIALSNAPNTWTNNNLNFNGIHTFDTNNTKLDFSIDYTKYIDKANNKYSNRFYSNVNTEIDSLYPNIYSNKTNSDINILTGALNFNKKLNKKLNLETGIKYSNVETVNNLLFERKDTLSENYYNDKRYSNDFTYTERVAAAYANFQQEIPHGSIQIGLRGENTSATGFNKTSGEKVNREYFQLFPNISLDYGKSENHKFQLSYSRRINRPDYNQLNPFKFYLDQYTASEGNPFLNPEKSHNASFTYIFKQFLYNTISYQRTEDVMQQYTVQDDATKETKQVTRNIAASNNYSYNVFAYIPVQKWLTTQINLTGWYMDFEGNVDGVNYKKGKPGWQLNVSNEIILPKNFTAEINGQYTSSLLWGVFQLKDQGSIDFGLKKSFWDNKASLKVGVSDLLYTDITRVKVQFENQDFSFKQLNDTRRVRLTFTYNFGKTKFKVREINRSDAEKNRIKKN
jgi:iron complex outermembrane recepter protein